MIRVTVPDSANCMLSAQRVSRSGGLECRRFDGTFCVDIQTFPVYYFAVLVTCGPNPQFF